MLEDKRKEQLDEFLRVVNLPIDNYSLLDVALTHSSFTFENKLSDEENNERLEFLGDAVLKLTASKYLYDRFPEYPEGELTKIRAILVSDKILAQIADKINLDKFLKLGYHEEKMGGRKRSSTAACAFEAILGAFYLDGKYHELFKFLTDIFEDEVTKIDQSASKYNFKAMLQEYAQGQGLGIPEYLVVKEDGPAHNKSFEVDVYVNGECLGSGAGKSKKEAHQNAAQQAVAKIGLLEGNEK